MTIPPSDAAFADLVWSRLPEPVRQRRLDRERIVEAAIAVADDGGAAALTMAAVADRLGPTTPMALYRHVHNKDGLVDLMLDRVTAEVDLPTDAAHDWRQELLAIARSTWAMVLRHPWYAELVHARPPFGPHQLARTEAMLRVLTCRGHGVPAALTDAAILDRYIVGCALQNAAEHGMRRRFGVASAEQFRSVVETARVNLVPVSQYPLLGGWMANPTGADLDEQFEIGLSYLIAGMD